MGGTLLVARADGELQFFVDLFQLRRAEQLRRSKMLFAVWPTQYGQQGQQLINFSLVFVWACKRRRLNRLPYVRTLTYY